MLVGALIGAGVGLLSTAISGAKNKASLKAQKDNAWQRYLINKEFADTQFSLQKGEAQTTLGIQQNRLREDLNTGVESFNTGLLGQAYGIQDAQMNLAGQLGGYDVAQGASGTRGNEASGLVKAYAQKSFDRNLGLQNSQNSQAMEGMITGANRGNHDINRERASWEEGGYRNELYQAEDERNRKLALLGQGEYDSAISGAGGGIFDYLMGGFQGASTGLSFSSSLKNAVNVGAGSGKRYSSPGYLDGFSAHTASIQQNSFDSIGAIGGNSFGLDAAGFMDRYYAGGSGLQQTERGRGKLRDRFQLPSFGSTKSYLSY